jgi:hypothetical protein
MSGAERADFETRFGGPRGNTPGMTSEQREAQIRNAWIVTDIHTRALERLKARLDDDAAVDAFLDKVNLNGLLKDAADRGFGTPKASVDVTTNGKDMPGRIDLNQLSPEALAELVALNDAARRD